MQYLDLKNKAGTKQNKRIEVVEEKDPWEGWESRRGWCEVDKMCLCENITFQLIILFNEQKNKKELENDYIYD